MSKMSYLIQPTIFQDIASVVSIFSGYFSVLQDHGKNGINMLWNCHLS
jgi:hypothetical protein